MSRIAITALSLCFPGANDLDSYWRNLLQGKDSRSTGGVNEFRIDPACIDGPGTDVDQLRWTRGGFIDLNDLARTTPADMPQGLDLPWQLAWRVSNEALAASDLAAKADLSRVGLVLGNYTFPTFASNDAVVPVWETEIARGVEEGLGLGEGTLSSGPLAVPLPEQGILSANGIYAVTRSLGLGGPAFSLDAACSSSLYAIELASSYLRSGKVDAMLAGGVCLPDPWLIHVSFGDLGAFPNNGVSQPFDNSSDGIVTGQGASVVVLRRLDDALKSNDKILAVIEGVGLSNDGTGQHMLVPNAAGQRLAYERAYARTDVKPSEVDYVECHATGTPLGDRTELTSLQRFFAADQAHFPLIGSVKANVGHLLTVAGMSSLAKVILAMQEGTIPATPGVGALQQSLEAPGMEKHLVLENRAWPTPSGKRHAAISAFGFGGTNAHMVVSDSFDPHPAGPSGRLTLPSLAILGMAAHFGTATSLSAFESACLNAQPMVTEPSQRRWRGAADHLNPEPQGAINAYEIDFLGNRIPPAETDAFNSQQGLVLKVANEALIDAGYGKLGGKHPPRPVAVLVVLELDLSAHLRRARVLVPAWIDTYLQRQGITLSPAERLELETACKKALLGPLRSTEITSYIGNICASRIASQWNFTGPVFTLSAGDLGVAYALEQAGLMIADDKAEAALVVAVDLASGLESFALEQAGQAAPAGPMGDGAGALVIAPHRPAADAEKPAAAYAVLDRLSIHHATADRPLPVDAALSACATDARPGLFEVAGTPGGLVAETDAAGRHVPGAVLAGIGQMTGNCKVAQPMAALIRAALSLARRTRPATPQAWLAGDGSKASVDAVEKAGLTLMAESAPWIREERATPLSAVIGNSGPFGSYAAFRLSEAEDAAAFETVRCEVEQGFAFLPLAGETRGDLLAGLARLVKSLEAGTPWQQLQRDTLLASQAAISALKAVLTGRDAGQLLAEARQLERFLKDGKPGEWQTPMGSYFTDQPLARRGKIAFVYPGGFNSYPLLGRTLLHRYPKALRQFERHVPDPAATLCQTQLYPPHAAGLDANMRLMQVEAGMQQDIAAMMKTGVGFALIYTALLRDDFAIRPQGAIGYSMGEVSMLFANGVWPIDDHGLSNDLPLFKTWIGGPRQVVRDAFDVAEKTPNSKLWASSVLLAPVQEVRDAVAARSDVFITHVNTPKEVVIAGLPDGVNAVAKGLSAYSSYRSPVSFILHVPILRRVADLIGDLHDHPSTAIAPDFELFTTATYGTMADFDRGALSRTITDVMCTEVDFVRMLDKAYDDGYRIFVECGPSATCSRWVSSTFAGREHLSINLNQRGADDEKSLIAALAKLVSHGVTADLTSLLPKEVQPASRTIISLEPGGKPLRATAKAVAATLKPQARPDPSQSEALPEASLPMPVTVIWGPTPEWLTKSALPVVGSAPISQPTAEAPKQERALPDQTFTPAPAHAAASQAETTAPPRLPARAEPAYARAASRAVAAAPRSSQLVQAILERHKLGHQTFLQTQAALIDLWRDQIGAGSQLIEHEAGAAVLEVERPVQPQPVVIAAPVLREEPVVIELPKVAPTPTPTPAKAPVQAQAPAGIPVPAVQTRAKPDGIFLDEQDLLTFASGKVADALGEQFAPIDAYPVRVRLPAPPYFFVSRVTKVQAEFGKYQPCSLTTEYDVPHDAWYLVDGQMPPGVAVESGQSDLLLVALLGIDFKNKGVRKYRLLDGRLSFYGRLPKAGSTLRFDISIDRFVWQGDGLLFFFRYDGYVDGELALQLHSGCAGFFTEDELNAGGGVVLKEPPKPPLELVKPLLPRVRNTLEKADLVALSHGRIAEIFGPGAQYPESGTSIRLPPEMLLMIDRVTDIGSWRSEHYVMEAEKEFDAEGWYYTSHFVDDPVLPGSLIAEGATQLLKVYLIANGMHQCFADGMFEPTTHREMQITVRGQITPAVRKVRYRLFLQESGLLPRPYVIADVLIYDENDKPLVRVSNLGLQVVEKPGASIEPRFGDPSWFSGRKTKDGEKVVLNELSMAHAAKGELRIGLGPEFNIYGQQHRAPHIPNGCFQFVDRCLETTGKRGEMKPGAVMDTEYDAHADSWYFQENSHPHMPNFVVLESALQAAILNGYALGPTLKFPDKVYSIRNLDGTAVYLSDPDTRGTTIRHSQTLLNTALLSDSILQNFDFNLKVDGQPFYRGQSSFGYFTAKALENQLGLDQGKLSRFWLEDNAGKNVETLDLQSPDEAHLFAGTDAKPHWRLPPGHRFRLLHKADLVRDGGKFGLGYIKGYRGIHAGEWYFTNHFHRDPVMPGSLGLEAILQAMQLFALKTGLDAGIPNPRFGIAVGVPVNWRYRGQLLRTDKDMNIEIHIKEIRKEADQVVVIADTDLFKEKLRIYEALSMSISIKPA